VEEPTPISEAQATGPGKGPGVPQEGQTPRKGRKGRPPNKTSLKPGQVPPGCYRDAKGVVRRIETPDTGGEDGTDALAEFRTFDRLAAMRRVLNTPRSRDSNPGLKAVRAWLEKSPAAFMESLERLESEARLAEQKADPSAAQEHVDETEEYLDSLTRELLAQAEERSKALPGSSPWDSPPKAG